MAQVKITKGIDKKKHNIAAKMAGKTVDSARTAKPSVAGGWHSKKAALAKKLPF